MFDVGMVERFGKDSARAFVRWDYALPIRLRNPDRTVDHAIAWLSADCRGGVLEISHLTP